MNLRTAPYLTLIEFVRPTQIHLAYARREYGNSQMVNLPRVTRKGFLLSQVKGKPKSRVLIYDLDYKNLTVTLAEWSWMKVLESEDVNTLMTSPSAEDRHFAQLVHEQYFIRKQNV